jgi:dienelactone hydrolase
MAELIQVDCVHEGLVLRGLAARPEGQGPHPAALVVHNAFGLGAQPREVARALAAKGFFALAVDMYGEGVYSEDREAIAMFVAPLWGNSERLRSRMAAWHTVLVARNDVDPARIAALGYCFGGQCVLEFARSGADIRAVASFHGILTTAAPAARGNVRAHVAIFTGALDPHAPRDHIEAVRAELISAEADWQITEFGQVRHAFTDRGAATPETGREYNPLADQVSWAATLALLSRAIGCPDAPP